jgi:CHRD domain
MKRTGAVLAVALVGLLMVGIAVAGLTDQWRTHLDGASEVPPRDTDAHGRAVLHTSSDGSVVRFVLVTSNITNVVQAHIHCGAAGVNGPIVVWLYPRVTARTALNGPQPPSNGVLARGSFTDADVVDRPPSPECPTGVTGLADVLALLNSGGAYANVHTNDGVAPTNTGPGDFPGGEIRGQLE